MKEKYREWALQKFNELKILKKYYFDLYEDSPISEYRLIQEFKTWNNFLIYCGLKCEYKYVCPGCNTHNTTEGKRFVFGGSLNMHIPTCENYQSVKHLYFDEIHNWINLNTLKDISSCYRKHLYPDLKFHAQAFKKLFKTRFEHELIVPRSFYNHEILILIENFKKKNNRYPSYRDFKYNYNKDLPSVTNVDNKYGGLLNMYKFFNIKYEVNNIFGKPTLGNDNILYRSILESEFANKFLYEKYIYFYEPKYLDGTNRLYDFYISELNCYIEINGQIPILEYTKNINNKIFEKEDNVYFITKSDIYRENSLEKMLQNLKNNS